MAVYARRSREARGVRDAGPALKPVGELRDTLYDV
jgi:hypothetical protein